MEKRKIYILENKETGVVIKCTVEYLAEWLSRGFEIIEVELGDENTVYLCVSQDDIIY